MQSPRVIALAGLTAAGTAALPLAAGLALGLVSSVASAAPVCAATLPYPVAVDNTGKAARAVLARSGRESCLRGKLTNALLGLSSSCEKEGRRDELCALADRAAVVTPMSLAFMDDTSRQLLRLIDPASPPPAGKGVPAAEAPAGEAP